MKLHSDRDYTVGNTFRVDVCVDTMEQMERAISLAFNNRRAYYVAPTKAFGLLFLETLETEKERRALECPEEFDIEPHEIHRRARTERYSITNLHPCGLSTGLAIEYVVDWFDRLDVSTFQYIAGPKTENWDLINWYGVRVYTGELQNHIGMHNHAICFVKPTWITAHR